MKAIIPIITLTVSAFAEPESLEMIDPAFENYFPSGTEIETVCTGFRWAEGPLWDEKNQYLIFSDVPNNTIYQWKEGDCEATIWMKPSGFTGRATGKESGANGLAFDRDGRVLFCEHGDRRVSVLTETGGKLTVADHYEGKRFNSPNDLCVHSSGAIYFTDPPYGLVSEEARETSINGVYRIDLNGSVTLMIDDLDRPNGIALSPDEQFLYVAQSHSPAPYIMRYKLAADGLVETGSVFFDCSDLEGPGSPDGLKIHPDGTVFSTGPGGLLVISKEGKLLGRVLCTRSTANVAFGSKHESIYLTSKDRVLRVPLAKSTRDEN